VPNEDPSSDAILIRPAALADVVVIAALESRSFHRPGERFDQRRVRQLISHPRFVVEAAERNGAVLGWVAGFVWLRGRLPWGRVYAIAVDPQARGQKLGGRLMENMIGVLESRGATRVFLEVRPDNQAALRLYHRLGFVECRSLPNYYGQGLTAIRMVRITASSPAASP
jgi:ribosomal-protein-alanine N-acetyltransferase